jgi:hypothetical protein
VNGHGGLTVGNPAKAIRNRRASAGEDPLPAAPAVRPGTRPTITVESAIETLLGLYASAVEGAGTSSAPGARRVAR